MDNEEKLDQFIEVAAQLMLTFEVERKTRATSRWVVTCITLLELAIVFGLFYGMAKIYESQDSILKSQDRIIELMEYRRHST